MQQSDQAEERAGSHDITPHRIGLIVRRCFKAELPRTLNFTRDKKMDDRTFFVAEFDQFLILRQVRDANAVKGAGSGLDRRSPV